MNSPKLKAQSSKLGPDDDGRWWVVGAAGLLAGASALGFRLSAFGSPVRLGPLLRGRDWQPIRPPPAERTNAQNLRLAVWLQQSPVGVEVSDATGTYGHTGRWDHDDREPVSDGWRRIERATDRWAERVSEGRLADTIDAWRADPGQVDPPALGSAVRLGPLLVPERSVAQALRIARAHRQLLEEALKRVRPADTDRRAELGRELQAAEADVVWWRHQVFEATDAEIESASRYTREAVAKRKEQGSSVRLGEIYKPPEYASGEGPWRSIRQLELANAAAGMFFFSKENLKFHNSRVMGPLYGGRYFVTSEKISVRFSEHPLPHPRLYSVRRASDDADIDTIGKHGQYLTLKAARRAAEVAAAAELRAAAMADRAPKTGSGVRLGPLLRPAPAPQRRRTFRPGTRVRISEGSGLGSNTTGTIVDRREVKTDGYGVPTNVSSGNYSPVDWTEEVAIRTDDGRLITMYKNRLVML